MKSTGFGEYLRLSRESRGLTFIQFLNGLLNSAFWVIFFLYLSQLGYEKYMIGILSGIGLYASFFVLIPSGYIADRFGRKRTLVVGSMIYLASVAMFLPAPSPLLMGLASALNGISNALVNPAMTALLSEKEPEERRKFLFSLSQSVGLLGGALGAFMLSGVHWTGEMMGSVSLGFWVLFYIYLLVGLYRFACVLLVKEKYSARKASVRKFIPTSWRMIGLFVFTNVIIGFGAGMVVPWFPLYFKETFSMKLTDLGLLFAISQLLWAATSLVMPVLASRFGSVRAIVASQGAAIILLVIIPNSRLLSLAIALYMARIILMNIAVPLASALQMNLVREHDRSSATATNMMSWQVSNATGQVIGGFMMSYWGMVITFYMTAVIYTLYLGTFFLFFRKYKKI